MEECASAPHLVFPYRRVYMRHGGSDQAVADANHVLLSAVDARGRSAQIFLVEVVVRRETRQRRVTARGRDIYAVTAPLVVEAATRVVAGRDKTAGVFAPGEIFDARQFLGSLCPEHLEVEFSQ